MSTVVETSSPQTAYVVEVPIRWGDLDAQGHINNATLLDFLQEARIQFLHSGPASEMLNTGVIVAKHEVEYLLPVQYSHRPLTVRMWFTRVGAAIYEIAYEILQDAQLRVRAHTTCCPFDFDRMRMRRLGAGERQQFADAPSGPRIVAKNPIAAVSGAKHIFSLATRWSDQDQFRHVNNVLYYDYFQEARADMLTRIAEVQDAEPLLWFIARQDVEYIKQLRYRVSPYAVQTAIERIGNTSLTFTSNIVDPLLGEESPIFAKARSVLVAANPKTGRPMPVPQYILTALTQIFR